MGDRDPATVRHRSQNKEKTIYNNVGAVERCMCFREPGAASRAARQFPSDHSSQTLDTATGSLNSRGSEGRAMRGLVLSRIRSLDPAVDWGSTSHPFGLCLSDHDPLSELSPSLVRGRAPIKKTMDLNPSGSSPGYPAGSPAALPAWARSVLYNRSDSFLATAAFPIPGPRQSFSRT